MYQVDSKEIDTQLAPVITTPKVQRRRGSAKGLVIMAEDFDAPLEDFKEYMQ